LATGIPNGIANKYPRPLGRGKESWCALKLIEEKDRLGERAIYFDSQTLFLWSPGPAGQWMDP
jgi:hypothetical protein